MQLIHHAAQKLLGVVLLETAEGRLRPTAQGRRFLNRLLAGFLA